MPNVESSSTNRLPVNWDATQRQVHAEMTAAASQNTQNAWRPPHKPRWGQQYADTDELTPLLTAQQSFIQQRPPLSRILLFDRGEQLGQSPIPVYRSIYHICDKSMPSRSVP
ncbi:unnamed protein product [Sphagnum balticum]